MPPGKPWEYDAPVESGQKVDEGRFQAWYHGMSKKYDLDPNPDDPRHFYDYRAAFAAGAAPDQTGHWPSEFKREGHPRLYVDGIDTRTGKPAPWAQDAPVDSVPNFPGKEASFSQGKPESAWHSAWESVRNSFFGHPDQAEAEAAGIYTQPPPSKLAAGAVEAGLMMYGGPAVAGALSKVPGVIGRVGTFAAEHPRVASAAAGAVPGLLRGNSKEAGAGAVAGAVLGAPGKHAIDSLRRVKDLIAAGKNAEAQAIIEALRKAAAEAPAAVMTAEKVAASEAAPVVEKAVEKAATQAAPVTATATDLGKAAVESHRKLVEFAREAAKANPKMGQKIWMELDAAGNPVRLLTPDQAGAAARKGLKTTWIKNLWGSTAGAFSE